MYRPLQLQKCGHDVTFLSVESDGSLDLHLLERSIRPDTAIVSVTRMDEIVSRSLWQNRLWGVLLAAFAWLALVLSSAGLYALMSFIVGQRTREIGIRLALGEPPATLAAALLKRGAGLALGGVIIGTIVTYPLTNAVGSLVFGFTTADPMLFAGAALALLVVALLACVVPARRVFTVDPLSALRE